MRIQPEANAVAAAPNFRNQGEAIAEGGADDHQQVAGAFDLGIVAAGERAETGAGELEPDEVVRMVDDTHLVGLRVADLDLHAGHRALGFGGGHRRRS